MSRSQFQSRIFILRHAWLNLWDERMTTGRINQVAIFPRICFQLWKLSTRSITYFVANDSVRDWSKLTLNQLSAKWRWNLLSRQSFRVQLEQILKHIAQRKQELSLATSFALSIRNAFASFSPSAKHQLERSTNKSIWDTTSHSETINQQTPRDTNRETQGIPKAFRSLPQQDRLSTDHTMSAKVETIGRAASSNLLHRHSIYASRCVSRKAKYFARRMRGSSLFDSCLSWR